MTAEVNPLNEFQKHFLISKLSYLDQALAVWQIVHWEHQIAQVLLLLESEHPHIIHHPDVPSQSQSRKRTLESNPFSFHKR